MRVNEIRPVCKQIYRHVFVALTVYTEINSFSSHTKTFMEIVEFRVSNLGTMTLVGIANPCCRLSCND